MILEAFLQPVGCVWLLLMLGLAGSVGNRVWRRLVHRWSATSGGRNARQNNSAKCPESIQQLNSVRTSNPPVNALADPAKGWRGWLWTWPVLPLAIVHLVGATPLSPWLLAGLERPYLRDWDILPQVDAVVILGGMHDYRPETLLGLDLAENADRLMTGIEWARRSGGLPIVFTGGSWELDGKMSPGSKILEDWLRDWGVLDGEVLHVWPCGNTRDEATGVRALMTERGWERVALVTSANHLRRAEATFSKVNVEVVPVGCEFHGVSAMDAGGNWQWLPRSRVLAWYQLWLHETLGWMYYRLKGWI
jgi:uncharacterized SAM-binding protein YcdF (DUF218 family)